MCGVAGTIIENANTVMGVDPAHGAALICRVGSTRESWRLPVAALTPLD